MKRAPQLGNFPLLAATEDLDLNQDTERTVKDDPAAEISAEQTRQFNEVLDDANYHNIGHTF